MFILYVRVRIQIQSSNQRRKKTRTAILWFFRSLLEIRCNSSAMRTGRKPLERNRSAVSDHRPRFRIARTLERNSEMEPGGSPEGSVKTIYSGIETVEL
jgi:hypothetical protein